MFLCPEEYGSSQTLDQGGVPQCRVQGTSIRPAPAPASFGGAGETWCCQHSTSQSSTFLVCKTGVGIQRAEPCHAPGRRSVLQCVESGGCFPGAWRYAPVLGSPNWVVQPRTPKLADTAHFQKKNPAPPEVTFCEIVTPLDSNWGLGLLVFSGSHLPAPCVLSSGPRCPLLRLRTFSCTRRRMGAWTGGSGRACLSCHIRNCTRPAPPAPCSAPRRGCFSLALALWSSGRRGTLHTRERSAAWGMRRVGALPTRCLTCHWPRGHFPPYSLHMTNPSGPLPSVLQR